MGCSDKLKRNCGKHHNAKCTDYEGELREGTELDKCDDISVEDVIEDINTYLDEVSESIDLSNLGNNCITYDKVDNKIQVKEALLKIEEAVCDIKSQVTDTDSSDCHKAFSADITCLGLDFKCLTDPCGNQIQNLGELLQALINQTCENVTP